MASREFTQISAFEKSLQASSLSPVYLLHGDESLWIEQAEVAIRTAFSAGDADIPMERLDASEIAVSRVIAAANQLAFLADRHLLRVRNCQAWEAGDWEQVAAYAASPNPTCCLVLSGVKLNTRSKGFAAVRAASVVGKFERLKEYQIGEWLQRRSAELGLRMEPRAIQFLADAMGCELLPLEMILGQLRDLKPKGTIQEEDLKEFLSARERFSIFDFVDAVADRHRAQALLALHSLLEHNEVPIRIAAMWLRQVRLMCSAREMMLRGESAGAVGQALSVRYPDKLCALVRRYRPNQLTHLHGALIALDRDLKSSAVDSGLLLEKCVMRWCPAAVANVPGQPEQL